MTTSKYVFTKYDTSTQVIINNIKLGNEYNRIPNSIIEIISCTVSSTSNPRIINIRSDLNAVNAYSSDLLNDCMGILNYDKQIIASHIYFLCGYEQPRYVMSNRNSINIGFYDESNSPLVINAYSILFKITSPKIDEISNQYRLEIPL
tara:strand:- start:701 stop:1144 length:444 start_codon:yes stop_codon:yes gene_type:complete